MQEGAGTREALVQLGEGGIPWVYDDAGRSCVAPEAERDCGVRAIAVATRRSYREVRDETTDYIENRRPGRKTKETVTTFLNRQTIGKMLGDGWTYVSGHGDPPMYFRSGDLPNLPVYIVSVSDHVCAVVDGVVHDVFDPTGDRARVWGYFRPSEIR